MRFEASITFGDAVVDSLLKLRGRGNTIREAREDLIKKIEQDEILFLPEKEALIKQIRELD